MKRDKKIMLGVWSGDKAKFYTSKAQKASTSFISVVIAQNDKKEMLLFDERFINLLVNIVLTFNEENQRKKDGNC